jgi:hypothetical protein
MDARRRNAIAVRLRFSKSFASRRHRPNQPRLRSTTHRFGRTSKPIAVSERFTIFNRQAGHGMDGAARRQVLRQCYIHPAIFEGYLDGGLLAHLREPGAKPRGAD